MTITVRDNLGQDVEVELTFRRDTVECRAFDRCQAVFDRDLMASWMTNPHGFFEADDAAFARTSHGYFICIGSLVPWHELQRADLSRLRELVASEVVPGRALL